MVKACDLEDGSNEEEADGDKDQSALEQLLKPALAADEVELVPANIQEEVDAEACEWAKVWAVGEVYDGGEWPQEMHPLPRITVEEIHDAVHTFASTTGARMGKDASSCTTATSQVVHPRAC